MDSKHVEVTVNVDISEIYDNVAIITITGDAKSINLSILGDSLIVKRCIETLNEVVRRELVERKSSPGRC